MFRFGSDFFRRRCRVWARGLVLVAGLLLPLPGMGAEVGPRAAVPNPTTDREPPAAGTPALRGTILSATPAQDRVIITDAQGREQLYARGDEITPGASIVEIHRTYVVLRRNGRLEKIDFSRRAAEPVLESASAAESDPAPPEDPEARRAAIFAHPELLLQTVGATTVVEGGQFRGYRVMQPQDPTLIKSLGFEPGDLLTAVNGMPLSNSSDYGAKVFEAVSGSGALSYTVQRGGRTLVVNR